jgi:hypothetical protein
MSYIEHSEKKAFLRPELRSANTLEGDTWVSETQRLLKRSRLKHTLKQSYPF